MHAKTQFEVHPAANIFPMMTEDEYQGLKEDIAEHGLRDSITVWRGQLIDGRNRLRACNELGIEPNVGELDDDADPVAWVVSLNLHRRHLDTSQRGMVGARIREIYDSDAKERKKRKPKSVKENSPEQNGQSRDKAGEAVSVSGQTIDRATKVLKSGNQELIAKVDSGELSLNAAIKEVDPPDPKPRPPKPKPPKPESFSAVRSYFDALAPEDKGVLGEFCEVCRNEGIDGDKLTILHGLIIDWCNI